MSDRKPWFVAVRENVAHIARGCRSGVSHNPAVYEQAIEVALAEALRDLYRAVALALVSARWEDGAADSIRQDVWDGLYAEKLLTTGSDQTGEQWPEITREGEDALDALVRSRIAHSHPETASDS